MSDDRLRALFDVLDVEATEERLSAALDAETTDPGRAEVLTQLARVAFWRDRPDEAERLLQEADSLAGETGVARARVLLERGRIVRRTGGDTVALSLLNRLTRSRSLPGSISSPPMLHIRARSRAT